MLHEGNALRRQRARPGPDGAVRLLRAARAPEGVEPEFVVVRDTPLVDGALAHFVARVVRSYWGGDHSLFLGQVEYARYGEGEPLLFHGGRYERMVGEPQLFSRLPARAARPAPARAGRELALRGRRDADDARRGLRHADARHVRVGAASSGRGGRSRSGRASLVGEIEVLDPGPGRMATITADEPRRRCIAVTRAELLEGLAADPQAAIALLEILAGRFRETG